jgi:hypothetical protein
VVHTHVYVYDDEVVVRPLGWAAHAYIHTRMYTHTNTCTYTLSHTHMPVHTSKTPGGGHGEIGFHLAKQLAGKGVKVTILNDQYSEKKEPFKVS